MKGIAREGVMRMTLRRHRVGHRPRRQGRRQDDRRRRCASSPTRACSRLGEDDDGRYLRFLEVEGKVDLTQNERFAEGEAERESFQAFLRLALKAQPDVLADDHQSADLPFKRTAPAVTNLDGMPVEMAERITAFDWERTALGSRRSWPSSLRVMIGVALRTHFPMLVFRGPDLVQIYNDAFVPILGARHPGALGQYARDCWPEIWDAIGPLLSGAFEHGTSVWGEDWPLTVERNGYPEATSFTFSYSQFGEPGEAGGVLCTCVETTQAVLREGRFRAITERLEEELDREHRALFGFQNAALPKRLPAVPGLRFDAMYEAAGRTRSSAVTGTTRFA